MNSYLEFKTSYKEGDFALGEKESKRMSLLIDLKLNINEQFSDINYYTFDFNLFPWMKEDRYFSKMIFSEYIKLTNDYMVVMDEVVLPNTIDEILQISEEKEYNCSTILPFYLAVPKFYLSRISEKEVLLPYTNIDFNFDLEFLFDKMNFFTTSFYKFTRYIKDNSDIYYTFKMSYLVGFFPKIGNDINKGDINVFNVLMGEQI